MVNINYVKEIKNIFPDAVIMDLGPEEDYVHEVRILTDNIENLPELIKSPIFSEITKVYKRAEGHYAIHARVWVRKQEFALV